MIRIRRLIFAAIVLLPSLANAGKLSIPSADLTAITTQLPKRAAQYADGVEETLELIRPYNYWNLSPIRGIQARAQFGASYYTEDTEAFTVPKPWLMTVELGSNCRAMVLNRKLRPRVILENVTLEALSQESVIGLMEVTVMNPGPSRN